MLRATAWHNSQPFTNTRHRANFIQMILGAVIRYFGLICRRIHLRYHRIRCSTGAMNVAGSNVTVTVISRGNLNHNSLKSSRNKRRTNPMRAQCFRRHPPVGNGIWPTPAKNPKAQKRQKAKEAKIKKAKSQKARKTKRQRAKKAKSPKKAKSKDAKSPKDEKTKSPKRTKKAKSPKAKDPKRHRNKKQKRPKSGREWLFSRPTLTGSTLNWDGPSCGRAEEILIQRGRRKTQRGIWVI